MADAESKPIDLENIDYDAIAQGVEMVGEDMGTSGVVDARYRGVAAAHRQSADQFRQGWWCTGHGCPRPWRGLAEREAAFVADRAQRSDRTRRIVEDVFRRPPAGDWFRGLRQDSALPSGRPLIERRGCSACHAYQGLPQHERSA